MTIRSFKQKTPMLGNSVYVDEQALLIGDVTCGDEVSVWPGSVVRGDIHRIEIGRGTNIQDGTIIHVTHDSAYNPGGYPTQIGDEVTVGHQVVLHGCSIGDQCLIGMGSMIMDGAVLHPQVLLAAGSLVTPGMILDGGYLWMGRPAKKMRVLTTEEIGYFAYSAKKYVELKNQYLSEGY